MTGAGAAHGRPGPACRFCEERLSSVMVDLGKSPLCQTMLSAEQLHHGEVFYPLVVYVCSGCSLVQIEEYVSPAEIFSHYVYFSSYSDSWLAHAERFADEIVDCLALDGSSRVIELGSNDGYLLQYFVDHGVPALGIEPAANVAEVARSRGVETIVAFFDEDLGRRLAEEGMRADLLCANNVLAQVPNLRSFVAGIAEILAPDGVITLEFPHLLKLIELNQFDTIYHEHFSYFSFTVVKRIFAEHGIELWDVGELPTHGGSLRVFGKRVGSRNHETTPRVDEMLSREQAFGVDDLATYASFGRRVEQAKRNLLTFLIAAKERGEEVAGYGAPGKGNTLLNYCGIRTDLLAYTVDRSPAKHGFYLPGSHIPVFEPDHIFETRPDYVLILPWNLKEEIMQQMSGISDWGGRFVVPIPDVAIYDPVSEEES